MRSVSPGSVEGRIEAPHSKSLLQRAVAAAVLAQGVSVIRARDLCADDESALAVAEALGARIRRLEGIVEIAGPAIPEGRELPCGESGLCIRAFAAVASLFDKEFTLTAEGSLKARPVEMVAAPLMSLGAECSTSGGLPPLTVKGPIRGGRVHVDGRRSSQFVTGLMIALPRCGRDSEIIALGLRSKPYAGLTVELLERFGVRIDADEGWERFAIPGGQVYEPADIAIEGDWSGAAFMLVAGATAGSATVEGLEAGSIQPDRGILDALGMVGADIRIQGRSVRVDSAKLRAFDFDATDRPDLFPPLVALAISCEGTSTIRGAGRLRHKESDRGAALSEEFSKLGAKIELDGDSMRVSGGRIAGGMASAHGDHRIAMALAIAALRAEECLVIEGDESVKKSYPAFFDDMKKIGARIG